MLQVNVCPICGGNDGLVKLDVNGDVASYKCQYCGNRFEENKVELYAEQLQSFLDEKKQEEVASLRALLYEEVHKKKYIDSERIVSICQSIREIMPDDFLACFFEAVNSNNEEETCEMLCDFDVEEYDYAVDYILDFMLKSLEHAYILPLNNLIENAYKNTDLEKYNRYATLLSKEAEKLEAGIYTPNLPRDVFLCYSSKDMPKVMELVNALESEGISCFVAARNLRHGVGAVQNYNEAIQTAIDYAKIVLFVSSTNSRKLSCDATKFELPYIRKEDIANAPAEYRQNYEKMPPEYKKPRVEYLLSPYANSTAEKIAKDFFAGNEWCVDTVSAINRVVDILTNGWYAHESVTPKKENVAPNPKSHSKVINVSQAAKGNNEMDDLLLSAEMSLESRDWHKALESAESALDIDPNSSDAALLVLLATLRCANIEGLAKLSPVNSSGLLVKPEELSAYKQAMYICDDETVKIIKQSEQERKKTLLKLAKKELSQENWERAKEYASVLLNDNKLRSDAALIVFLTEFERKTTDDLMTLSTPFEYSSAYAAAKEMCNSDVMAQLDLCNQYIKDNIEKDIQRVNRRAALIKTYYDLCKEKYDLEKESERKGNYIKAYQAANNTMEQVQNDIKNGVNRVHASGQVKSRLAGDVVAMLLFIAAIITAVVTKGSDAIIARVIGIVGSVFMSIVHLAICAGISKSFSDEYIPQIKKKSLRSAGLAFFLSFIGLALIYLIMINNSTRAEKREDENDFNAIGRTMEKNKKFIETLKKEKNVDYMAERKRKVQLRIDSVLSDINKATRAGDEKMDEVSIEEEKERYIIVAIKESGINQDALVQGAKCPFVFKTNLSKEQCAKYLNSEYKTGYDLFYVPEKADSNFLEGTKIAVKDKYYDLMQNAVGIKK